MKETKFIEQNKKKWQRFEELSKSSYADPDELSDLFVEITDDLSYARTHYPKRTVRVYLNQLAQGVFLQLHKTKKTVQTRFFSFWTTELPLEMFRARKILLVNLIIFLLAVGIGCISTENDIDFARVVMGDDYVDMTDRYIEEGDPMKVYDAPGQTKMEFFAYLVKNNLRVALFAFAFGILFSVGTLFFMMVNGIMVGAFKYYMYLKGVFVVASSAIWLHGAFEISAIVIAGAAGLVVGNSLLFPGTYTRGQSLIIGGKRGIKIMLGTVPFIIIAGYIESHITRNYLDMPAWQNWTIIFGCFALILMYFVIYPWLKFKNNPDVILNKEPVFNRPKPLQKWRVRKLNETFTSSLSWYRAIFNNLGGWLFGIMGCHMLVVLGYMYFSPSVFNYIYGEEVDAAAGLFSYYTDWKYILRAITGLSDNKDYILVGMHILFMSLSATTIWFYFKEDKPVLNFKTVGRFLIRNVWKVIPFMAILFSVMLSKHGGVHFLGLFILPIALMSAFSLVYKNNPISGFKSAFVNYAQHIGVLLAGLVLVLLCHYFMVPLRIGFIEIPSNMIYEQLEEYLSWHVIPIMDHPEMAGYMLDAVFYMLLCHLLFPILLISMALEYFSVRERKEAHGLFERLKTFGKKSKIYESDFEDTV